MNTSDKATRLGEIYAQTLFELAEQFQLVDAVKNDLDVLANLAAQLKDFETLMTSPYFYEEQKKQLVHKVFSERLNDLTTNFLMTVIKHNRMGFLQHIVTKYNELWETHHGWFRVKVTVSKAMNNDEIERLTRNVTAAMNNKVKLELAVNPSIIGGIIIRSGDKLIDNTIKSRLQLMVKTIINQGKTYEV